MIGARVLKAKSAAGLSSAGFSVCVCIQIHTDKISQFTIKSVKCSCESAPVISKWSTSAVHYLQGIFHCYSWYTEWIICTWMNESIQFNSYTKICLQRLTSTSTVHPLSLTGQNTWSISSWPDCQSSGQIRGRDATVPARGFRVWGELNPASWTLNC